MTSTGCFVPVFGKLDFLLSSDFLQDGEKITTLATFVKDDGRRFEFSYRTKISLLTLTPEAFGFYDRLASQLSIEGDIFDPPPANILGNILSIDEPNSALGFFGAYYESSEEFYIENDILEFQQAKIKWSGNCTNLDSSSLVKPLTWTGSSW